MKLEQLPQRENDMRLFRIVAIAAMMTLTLNAADVAGTWKGSFDTQMGTMENTITLKAGAELTGSIRIGDIEAAVEKGRLDGDKIFFEVATEHGRLTHSGTVAGDEMKLNVVGTTGTRYTMIARRQK